MANLDGTDIVHGERLLAQRSLGWKLACSAWVLLVGVGFVFFSVLGWAIGSALSRARRMWLFTAMWFALYILAIIAIENSTDGTEFGVWIFIAIWIGSIGHAAYLSRGVLRARAVALAKDQGWREATGETSVPQPPPAPPQPDMPTIPLPDGVSPRRRDLRDS